MVRTLAVKVKRSEFKISSPHMKARHINTAGQRQVDPKSLLASLNGEIQDH